MPTVTSAKKKPPFGGNVHSDDIISELECSMTLIVNARHIADFLVAIKT